MGLSDILERAVLTRRLVHALERQATALETQNTLLARLVDHLAPVLQPPTEQELKDTGPVFTQNERQARYMAWHVEFLERVGREPNDLDIEEWLREDAERAVQ